MEVNRKIFLIMLKTIPILLASISFINTTLNILGVKIMFLTSMSFISVLPLIFLYMASYVFQFCAYHRMFLHYLSFILLLNTIDLYWIIPISRMNCVIIFMIITFIFLIITLYKYLKSKRHVDKNI